ncbi:ABC transporter substrate-binding protein [Azospirillum agricola]|uniref:ABC transporter substrate-binding protein n=1 Tax=Azospirillum agricola TaxID=1720247 RepID=UPI000A0F15FC|nr:ABC transporter substrate-binding protein [Azospirillum agricola]SMH61360.1 peptide/nickel transport system substrate-binding protein [Azospirillum lipoferum]
MVLVRGRPAARPFVRPFALAALAFGLAALPLQAGAQQAAAPVRGGTLIATIEPQPSVLTTAFNNQYANAALSTNVYDGLLSYAEDLSVRPSLAESWEVAPDGLSITFKLRHGVKWHDGVEFTSDDVKFSALEVWKKTHPRGRLTFASLQDVETPDRYTAVFRLSAPSLVILSALNAAESQILPKHVFEGAPIQTNPATSRPVGTGPFRFKDWKKGQYVELERNPDYWDEGKPYLDRVIFKAIPDTASRAAALETGEVQYAPYDAVPFGDVARLRKDPNLRFETRGYDYHSQFYILEFNLRNPILANDKVRKAVAHAVDKAKLVETVWYGLGKPSTGPIPASVKTFYTSDVQRYDFDVAAANRLLDEGGYPRKADGIRFALNLDFTAVGDVTSHSAEFIRQNLKAVGIDAKLNSTDDPTYLRKVYKDYSFDLNLLQISPLIDPQMGLFRLYWTKAQAPGVPYVNASSYSSPAMDGIIEAIRVESDADKRKLLFHDLQRQAMNDLPLVPLFDMQHFTFYNRKVHGINTTPDGAISSLKNVWIER